MTSHSRSDFFGITLAVIVGIGPFASAQQTSQTGGNLTETWQAVDVTGNPPDFVELNAWANSSTRR